MLGASATVAGLGIEDSVRYYHTIVLVQEEDRFTLYYKVT